MLTECSPSLVYLCRVLQQEQSAIPAVLSLFLGPKGLGHPSTDVATRACYLLSRLVKTLRANLRPYIDEMLRQMQQYLVVVATQPPPSGGSAVGEDLLTYWYHCYGCTDSQLTVCVVLPCAAVSVKNASAHMSAIPEGIVPCLSVIVLRCCFIMQEQVEKQGPKPWPL